MIEKGKYNVLIMHQYPKEYKFSKDEEHKKNFEESKYFDLVITGHYHQIEEFNVGKTRYLNPGSSLAAFGNEEKLEPSIWIFDTETKEYERVKIPEAVRIVAKEIDNPDDFLNDIKEENIYRLTVKTLPEKKTLMNAKKVALDVQLKLKEKEESTMQEEISDF